MCINPFNKYIDFPLLMNKSYSIDAILSLAAQHAHLFPIDTGLCTFRTYEQSAVHAVHFV